MMAASQPLSIKAYGAGRKSYRPHRSTMLWERHRFSQLELIKFRHIKRGAMKKEKTTDYDIPIPEGLTDSKARELWNVTAGKKIKGQGRLIMLEEALRTLQRVNKTQTVIDDEGLTVEGKDMAHCHPLLKILQKDLQILSKMWVSLGLNNEYSELEKW